MPCSGPNCPYAESQGDKAYTQFAMWLSESYGIPTPEHIASLGKQSPLSFGASYRSTLEAHTKLREAVRDLFVSEACDSW